MIVRKARWPRDAQPEHPPPPGGEWVLAALLYTIFALLMDGAALVVMLPRLIARGQPYLGLGVLASAVLALPLVPAWIALERGGRWWIKAAALILNSGYVAGFAATFALCLIRMSAGRNGLLEIVVPGVPVTLAYALNVVALLSRADRKNSRRRK